MARLEKALSDAGLPAAARAAPSPRSSLPPSLEGKAGASPAAVPGTVKLLSELERSWAMFAASWRVVDLFAGAQIWQESAPDAPAEPLNALLLPSASAGAATFLAGSIGGGGTFVALLLTLAVVAAAIWTLSAARAARPVPGFKTLRVIDGAPSEIFLYLMNVRNLPVWDASIERAEVVHTIDDHSDIIHVVYRPVWIWPLWITPRDVCLLRYWRRAEDGSYVICMQSAIHPECPPTHGTVRATCRGGGFIISPRAPATSSDSLSATSDELTSLVTSVVHLDPCGWEGALLQRLNALLVYLRPQILSLTGLQEVWEARKFVCPNVPDEFGAVLAASGGATAGDDATGTAQVPVDPTTGEPIEGAIATDGGHILQELPTNVPRAMWAEPEGTAMMVRGPDYLTDRRKIPSAPPAFRLVGVDLFKSPKPREHITSHPNNIVQKELARHREAGTTMPFTFVMNFVVPGNPCYNLVLYYQVAPGSNVLDDGSAFAELMRDFLDGSDEFRNERFKLIPCIVEGPFIVRQAVGTTPAIIGKKLRMPCFSGPQYFELDVDISSSAVANRVVGLVIGYTKKLVIDMGFLVEGQRPDELPERLFGAARLVHLDMGVAQPLE